MKNIVPISDLQRQAAQLVMDVNKGGGQPIIITQRGRAAAVLMSAQHYEQMEEELELLDDLKLAEMLRQGLEDRAAGNMISLDEAKKRLNYPG